MAETPEILLDRRSGRSSSEFEPELDLTLQERVSRFEAAEMELGMAERAELEGVNKTELNGTFEEVSEAIKVLKQSAEYHASRIQDAELQEAVEKGNVQDYIAQAVRDRRATIEGTDAVGELLEDYDLDAANSDVDADTQNSKSGQSQS